MKKAYVKPMFFAEEFAATATVAVCPVRSANPLPIHAKDFICSSPGHAVDHNGKAPVHGYWDYATSDGTDSYIFNSGEGACDFVWNSGNGPLGFWTSVDTEDTAVAQQNWITDASQRNPLTSFVHWLTNAQGGFMDFMDFFRGPVNDGCTPMFELDGDGNMDNDTERLFS